MSSMDFVPPSMTTDQDATAARLRAAVKGAAQDWALYFEPPPRFGTPLTFEEREANFTAALDTLIQYHRSAGAVEALAPAIEAEAKFREERYPGESLKEAWAAVKREYAAAQARLAAYEEKR